MSSSIRWGILGPGSIANQFAKGLQATPAGQLVAVGSRDQQRADAFADQYDAPNRHGSYESLVADPDIDAIYVATPHPFHKENSILCLEAGKAVLCEKPFTVNATEAAQIITVARDRNIFLMEAMQQTECFISSNSAVCALRLRNREHVVADLQWVR